MEWIKVNKQLHSNFKVLMIAEALGMDAELVAYKIIQVWAFADTECTAESPRVNAPVGLLDKLVRCPGLANGMADVGWLTIGEGWFEFPKFERHMGKSSKVRMLNLERKRLGRDLSVTKEGQNCDTSVTKEGQKRDQTRGDKTRGDKTRGEEIHNPPLPPQGDAEGSIEIKNPPYDPQTAPLPLALDTEKFRNAWCDWWESRRERKLPRYKPMTIARALKRFLEIGEDMAIATIEHSIMKAYHALVEPTKAPTFFDRAPERKLKPLASEMMPADLAAEIYGEIKPNHGVQRLEVRHG